LALLQSFGEVLVMPLLYLVLALIVVAVIARLLNTYVPMPANVRPIVNIVLVLLESPPVLECLSESGATS
jgi:hypothetical protein